MTSPTPKLEPLSAWAFIKGWAIFVLAYLVGGFLFKPSRYSHGRPGAQLLDQLSAAAIGGIVFQVIRLIRDYRARQTQR